MKVQKFYPKQVLKSLVGRDIRSLDTGEIAAYMFFMRKGRKYGYSISCINSASPDELFSATSKEHAETILANANQKILLHVA